jgi:hypothetical protein
MLDNNDKFSIFKSKGKHKRISLGISDRTSAGNTPLLFSLESSNIGRDDLNGGTSNERQIDTIGTGANAGKADKMTIEWTTTHPAPDHTLFKPDYFHEFI